MHIQPALRTEPLHRSDHLTCDCKHVLTHPFDLLLINRGYPIILAMRKQPGDNVSVPNLQIGEQSKIGCLEKVYFRILAAKCPTGMQVLQLNTSISVHRIESRQRVHMQDSYRVHLEKPAGQNCLVEFSEEQVNNLRELQRLQLWWQYSSNWAPVTGASVETVSLRHCQSI